MLNDQDNALLGEFQKIADAMHATYRGDITKSVDAMQAEIKGHNASLTELVAKVKTELEEKCASIDRLMKERTARMPGVLTGDGSPAEWRSLGARFSESAEFKAWAALDRSRDPLRLSLPARILTPTQQKAVTVAGSGVTLQPYVGPIIAAVQPPLVMRDLLPVVRITSPGIEYQQMTVTGAADYQVAEGDKKAEATVAYTPKQANVKTIAVFLKASRQMMSDAPFFASIIDNQLLFLIAQKEDYELLWGDNAAGHLHGIMPQAPALAADVIADQTTPADQLLAAVAYLSSIGYPANGIVMNPLDWASLQAQKLATGAYLLGGPPASFPPNSLWGLPIVLTPSMLAGQFLVGNFNLGATLFDREAANTDTAFENEDDFVRNLVTIRAEERIALAVWRPNAFVKSAITFPVVTP